MADDRDRRSWSSRGIADGRVRRSWSCNKIFVKDTQLRSDRDRRSARSKRINAIVVGDRQIKDPTALKNPIVIVDLTDRIKYPKLRGLERCAGALVVHFDQEKTVSTW